ncbi:two component transcriptional regulator, winged helix family protein [Fusobacterium necrophorum subsp. funduliforme B35]|uniref:Chemotaxis protein CheY n=1 Tax=Fusobacterium necrophorum subsp. funduliforme B35 TaxID=1226633 RepID=A0A017H748_9FUSO|nr:response regulator transcription factor [Fusobacterium necrophorum]EYD70201.1 two component transcriptional regulator, winged helix family protein [Fusobacterium necrophorum subsp. funduliforme B35]KID49323.1 chemotaxis protein CheY [Fusobacterium necrophorum subsp. funduliforme B35]
MKILLVEDEKELLETIGEGLRSSGYYVDLASCGKKAMEYIDYEEYDLFIFDLNLPDISGFEILKYLNQSKENPKVLILTANASLETKVEGFDLGASDYLTKPFYFKELEIRVKALLRRNFRLEKIILTCGKLRFDTQKRILYANEEEVTLTKKETAIIEYLLFNQDKVVTAENLLAHAWDSEVDYFSNSIRVHLASLRKKIKAILGYNPIINKIGEGYFLKK